MCYSPTMSRDLTIESSTQLQPLEDFLDRNHPTSDEYMQAVELIQRNIMHTSSRLRAKHVQMVKLSFAGLRTKDIAQRLGTTPSTVSRITNSDDGKKLLQLLNYHQIMLEGPNLAQRRNMLWRIATTEEHVDPKTSIKAVEALNKMTTQDWERDNPEQAGAAKGGTAPVIININQDTLPRGALDA